MVRFKTMKSSSLVSIFIIFIISVISEVYGHGRLVEPPSRSSMWRFGFKTKPNYNDNELFCGGYTVHFQRNKGQCGVCGDAYNLPSPRPNEAGGVYGRGVIVRQYKPGQVIKSVVEITANHKGFFEFKLCPHNSPTTVVSQDCLDKYLLEMADGSGPRYYPAAGTGPFVAHLRLPDHVSCSQCVFQWTYTAGNNWGRCENGSSAVGCGPQETFRGCADVSIDDNDSNDIPSFNDIPSYNDIPLRKPSISAIPTRRSTTTTRRPWSRPTRPSRRPYYNNRKTITRTPVTRRPIRTRPPVTRRPVPSRPPVTRRPVPSRPPVSRRPVTTRPPVTRRPLSSRRPITRRPYNPPSRPTQYYDSRPTSKRVTTRRPTYSRPTPYRPIYTPRPTPYRPVYDKDPVTKKPRPTYKPKVPPKKYSNVETEGGSSGGCRAVGVWQSISGIASWCDSNCARGYCPSSHCDCS